MKKPKSICVMGIWIPVLWDDKIEDHGLYSVRSIKVKSDDPEKDQMETILHELLHAILDISGHNKRMSEASEEALVSGVSAALRQLVVFDRKSKNIRWTER